MKSLVHNHAPVISKYLFFTGELYVGGRHLIFLNRGSSWQFGLKHYVWKTASCHSVHLTCEALVLQCYGAPLSILIIGSTPQACLCPYRIWWRRHLEKNFIPPRDFTELMFWKQCYSGVFVCLNSNEDHEFWLYSKQSLLNLLLTQFNGEQWHFNASKSVELFFFLSVFFFCLWFVASHISL